MLYLEPFGATHAGKVRKNNEDSLLVGEGRDGTLFAVADGIGGFEAGEVASSIAINALKGVKSSGSLEAAIKGANRGILQASRSDEKLSGMGTTVVAARFKEPGRSGEEPTVEISHVGDSRAYLLRDGEMKPITEDHSLVAELVRSGDLTRAEASEHPQRNLITRALGAEEAVEVDTAVLPVEPGDRFLLCSDGLSDMVKEAKIAEILASAPDPKSGGDALIKAALDGGGSDNITVVVVDVREDGPAGASADGRIALQAESVSPEDVFDTTSRRGTPSTPPSGRERPQGRGFGGKKRAGGKRRKRSAVARVLAALVRGVAALLVLAALASPFYLWATNQYYLGFDRGVVVIYNGLPYAPFDFELNREVERTTLRESEVDDLYRDQIVTHELKSREEAERVVRDLEAADPPTQRR